MPDHKKLWDDWRDRYLLEFIETSFNYIPTPPKSFETMSETEFNSWLSKIDVSKLEDSQETKFKVAVPTKQVLCKNSQIVKTDVLNLPLSLEDNSSLNGTASIFDEFGKEFLLPCPKNSEIPFNKAVKKFDLQAARTQFDFMRSVSIHQAEMLELQKQMASLEKDLDGANNDNVSSSGSDSNGSEEE